MFLQQGDVLLRSVSKMPKGKTIERKPSGFGAGKFVLAEGEVTGHCHAIESDIELIESNGTMYMKNDQPVTLKHEEHHHIEIPSGNWEIGIVQEYDHFAEEAKNVAD